MSAKKSATKVIKSLKLEERQLQETPTEVQPESEALETPPEPVTSTTEPEPTTTPAPAPTFESLFEELQSLKMLVEEHASLIIQLQETLARKRKPVASNGKIQIRDKQTGTVYPSKNNVYQTLLKSGELKDLVDKGIFGSIPQKNTFGWYVLVREWPDRFEEVHGGTPEAKSAQ